jgi:hypothetical protein
MPRTLDIGFSIDHVMAVKHGGSDGLENLALACLHRNRHKGTDLTGLIRSPHRLFHFSIRARLSGADIFDACAERSSAAPRSGGQRSLCLA